jgi:hypothetical protein
VRRTAGGPDRRNHGGPGAGGLRLAPGSTGLIHRRGAKDAGKNLLVQGSGVQSFGSSYFNPHIKLNGTIPNRKVIFRDTIPGIEVFINVKFQNQISRKSQISLANDPARFVILIFGHCDLFIICYLRFGIFHRNLKVSSSIQLDACGQRRR